MLHGEIEHGGQPDADEEVRRRMTALADRGQEAVPGVDSLVEAVVVVHPDNHHVLRVVPDVEHEPPVVDVRDQQIAGREHGDVAEHVRGVQAVGFSADIRGAFPNQPDEQARAGEERDDVQRLDWNGRALHRHSEEEIWLLGRSPQDSNQGHEVDDAESGEIARRNVPARFAQVHARDAVALARVVKPLPIEVDRGDNPRAEREAGRDRRCGDQDRQLHDEEAVGPKAVSIERQPREGGHDVLVAEKPNVEGEDGQEEAGVDRDA